MFEGLDTEDEDMVKWFMNVSYPSLAAYAPLVVRRL